jgi:two-component system response regulator FixJ
VRLFDSAQIFLNELSRIDTGCVVTDIRMPGIDGIELLRQLNSASGVRKLPVIIMTGHGDVPLAVEAMKLGALDFLEKPFEDERLVNMIETALSQSDSGSKSETISDEMASRVASLTQRERQVMQGLVTGQSNKVIAREYDISPRTVEVYRANVMTKMQAGNLSELVRFAIRAGMLKD